MKDELFKGYVSNTSAAFCAQDAFFPDSSDEIYTGRIFYRIFAGGEYQYRLYFGNIVDSTYGDGTFCHPNEICNSWKIHSAKVSICSSGTNLVAAEFSDAKDVTFLGAAQKTVMPGEIFCTDDILLKAQKNDYLCLEIAFSGTKIPYLVEASATVPTFVRSNGVWMPDVKTPGAFLVGCNRNVKKHIAFLGDSITMGCGTTHNAYLYWMARVAEGIGEEYAFWNLGIGYAKMSDAATDGAWLYKTKQADFVNVALGTNDLLQGREPDDIANELHYIVDKLNKAGCEVGLFTAPPFCYSGSLVSKWEHLNRRICSEFAEKSVYIFDTCPMLDMDGDMHGNGKYEPHPNDEGCGVLAKAFLEFIKGKNLFG